MGPWEDLTFCLTLKTMDRTLNLVNSETLATDKSFAPSLQGRRRKHITLWNGPEKLLHVERLERKSKMETWKDDRQQSKFSRTMDQRRQKRRRVGKSSTDQRKEKHPASRTVRKGRKT